MIHAEIPDPILPVLMTERWTKDNEPTISSVRSSGNEVQERISAFEMLCRSTVVWDEQDTVDSKKAQP